MGHSYVPKIILTIQKVRHINSRNRPAFITKTSMDDLKTSGMVCMSTLYTGYR